MRLLIHAVGIARGGGLRHLGGLLPALARQLDADDRVVVLVRHSVAQDLRVQGGDARVRLLAVPDRWGTAAQLRIPLDQLGLPLLALRERADVVVSFANFGPVAVHAPHVVVQTNALYFDPSVQPLASRSEQRDMWLRAKLIAATLRRADVVIAPSHAMADLLTGAIPPVAARLSALPHGIDVGAFPRRGEAAPREGRFTFVSPGLGAFYKGLDVLVPAVARVDRRFTVRALARTVDWPEGVTAARENATKLGLGDRLVFEEEVEQTSMATVYGDADALVYPTRCESFGFTLLEALCAGLPVVASDLPVNREIAGDAALYYDVDSPKALANAMRRLIDDKTLRTQLMAAARARIAAQDWSWERNARELLAVCRNVAR